MLSENQAFHKKLQLSNKEQKTSQAFSYLYSYASIIIVLVTSALCYLSGLVPQSIKLSIKTYKTAHTACAQAAQILICLRSLQPSATGVGKEMPPPGTPLREVAGKRRAGGQGMRPRPVPAPARRPRGGSGGPGRGGAAGGGTTCRGGGAAGPGRAPPPPAPQRHQQQQREGAAGA